MSEINVSFTINRHVVIGLAIGLVLGSLLTVLGARLMDSSSAGNGSVGIVDTANPEAPLAPIAEITISDSDYVRGSKDAPVVLVEYSDFQCSFCKRHHSTMQSIVDKYGDQVAWVYKHFPLEFHPQAIPAALASECAGEQGKFWEFTDKLIEKQSQLGDALYNQLASDLGLDTSKFSQCYTSGKYNDKVTAHQQEGAANGVSGTPATFVNGVMVSGAVPLPQFEQVIDQELRK